MLQSLLAVSVSAFMTSAILLRAGEDDVAAIMKVFSFNTQGVINISFNEWMFQQFYDCLCIGEYSSCKAIFEPETSNVSSVTGRESKRNKSDDTRSYICVLGDLRGNNSWLECTRSYHSSAPETRKLPSQELQSVASSYCKVQCVKIMWFWDDEGIIFNGSNFTFQSCEYDSLATDSDARWTTARNTGTISILSDGGRETQITQQPTRLDNSVEPSKPVCDILQSYAIIVGVAAVAAIIIAVAIVVVIRLCQSQRKSNKHLPNPPTLLSVQDCPPLIPTTPHHSNEPEEEMAQADSTGYETLLGHDYASIGHCIDQPTSTAAMPRTSSPTEHNLASSFQEKEPKSQQGAGQMKKSSKDEQEISDFENVYARVKKPSAYANGNMRGELAAERGGYRVPVHKVYDTAL